jgi:hypothetical protein
VPVDTGDAQYWWVELVDGNWIIVTEYVFPPDWLRMSRSGFKVAAIW